MTTFNTGNAVPSKDPRDLLDNAENADNLINGTQPSYNDRLGVSRKSLAGMESDFATDQSERTTTFANFLASSGYVGTGAGGAIEDYAGGIEITEYNQIIRESGEFYRAKASLSLPYTTTGTWVGDDETRFVSVGDAALRQEIGSGIFRADSLANLESSPGRFDGDAARLASGTGRDGDFRWDSSDLSATLVLASATSDSVDDTTDTINDADHPFSDGDGVITQTTVNGLTAQTVYWVVNSTAGTYQLSATFGGGAVDLTGTTNVTIDHLIDPMQGIYVAPTADKTGAIGAWVRTFTEVYDTYFGVVGGTATDHYPHLKSALSIAAGGVLNITESDIGLSSPDTASRALPLQIPSDTLVRFSPQASIQELGYTGSGRTFTLWANGVTGVRIENPRLLGERDTTASLNEQLHGIGITNSSVTIVRPDISKYRGDGIYVQSANDSEIYRPHIYNCIRQGISVIKCQGLDIIRPVIHDITGESLPGAGIDIEPNLTTDEIKGLRIVQPLTYDTFGGGVTVALFNLSDAATRVEIDIEKHTHYRGVGFDVFRMNNGATKSGRIVNDSPQYYNADIAAIRVERYDADNDIPIEINYPLIVDANENNSSATYGSAINIGNWDGDAAGYDVGATIIRDPQIVDTRGVNQTVRGIRAINAEAGFNVRNLEIIDPLGIDAQSETDKFDAAGITSGLVMRDMGKSLRYTGENNITLTSRIFSELVYTLSNTNRTVTLYGGGRFVGNELRIRREADDSSTLDIAPASGEKILPLGSVDQAIRITGYGEVSLLKASSDTWLIRQQSGDVAAVV